MKNLKGSFYLFYTQNSKVKASLWNVWIAFIAIEIFWLFWILYFQYDSSDRFKFKTHNFIKI